ncbi:MAG TPA: Maf family protein, partial [Casimicrobiaceae bacterium]|nr:Maf family protein [Casimicrobiaceae bacterium]
MSTLFMLTERPSVYLASKSPRRHELLRQIGVEFEELLLREAPGRRRDIVEVPRKDEAPFEYVKRVARTKAAVGWHRMGRRELLPKPVLAADTEVVVDGIVLG